MARAQRRARAGERRWLVAAGLVLGVGALLVGRSAWSPPGSRAAVPTAPGAAAPSPPPTPSSGARPDTTQARQQQSLGGTLATPRQPVPLAEPAATATGALAGTVRDATGGPVPGARVESSHASDPASSAPIEVTETDEHGGFVLPLASDERVVTARAEGYSVGRRRVAASARSLSIVLAPASTIRGKVVDEVDRQPVADVVVRATREDAVAAMPELVRTGADGAFELAGLTPGSHLLMVAAEGYRSDPRVVDVGLGEVADAVELSVYPAVAVSALVSFASGSPCTGGNVRLEGPLPLAGSIGEDGAVRFEAAVPGTYRALVHCDGARPLDDVVEVGVAPVHREWHVESGLSLLGSVERASGGPHPRARLVLAQGGSGAEPAAALPSGEREPPRVIQADDEGEFRVTGLAAGPYALTLLSGMASTGSPEAVIVSEPGPTHVRLVAPAGGEVRVSLPALDEAARRALLLFATHHETGRVAQTTQAEAFVFAGLELGTYSVSTAPCGAGAGTAGAATGGRVCPLDAVELTLERDGQVEEVRLPLDRSHVIEGRVVDERGAPVPEAWVWAEHDFIAPGAEGAEPAVLSDAEGAFRITGLGRGRHVLGARSPAAEVTGVVAESDSHSAVLRLERLGAISGSVLSGVSPTAPPFRVEYLHESGSGGAVAGSRGRFDVPRLRPGHYRLSVVSAHGAAQREVLVEPGARIETRFVLSQTAPK